MSLVRRDSDISPIVRVPGYAERPVWEAGTARNVLAVLFKWKWLIIGAFFAVFLPIVIFSLNKPTLYQARAKVIIKQERAYLAVTASDLERIVNTRRSIREVLNSEMQIIKSQEVIGRAVKELQLDQSVDSVRNALAVTPIRDSNIIQIILTSADPETPAKLVNKIVKVYREQHAAIHNPEGVLSFFEKQVALYGQKLREAEQRLYELEAQARIPGTDMGIAEALDSIAGLRKERQATELERGELEKQIALLREEIARQPAMITETQETVMNPVFMELTRGLTQLELDMQTLLQRYVKRHPRVLTKRREIEETRARLAAVTTHVSGRRFIRANPVRQALEGDLWRAQARMESSLEKQRALDRQLALTQEYLPELNRKRFEYQQLQQEVEVSRRNYALYQKKREEARISEAMDRDKLINVGVVERATPSATPIAQRRKSILLLAAFTGIAVGVCTAFGVEFFNPAFKDEREMEKHLELPVLATIEHFQA
jgi:uncharacterized protein involved in exopolysaccharide biosynthesis